MFTAFDYAFGNLTSDEWIVGGRTDNSIGSSQNVPTFRVSGGFGKTVGSNCLALVITGNGTSSNLDHRMVSRDCQTGHRIKPFLCRSPFSK